MIANVILWFVQVAFVWLYVFNPFIKRGKDEKSYEISKKVIGILALGYIPSIGLFYNAAVWSFLIDDTIIEVLVL